MTTFVDLHLIHSVPPSCINRDDSGSPKTAMFGGVKRHRVSSQSWKKATRDEFKELLPADKVGIRTKRIVSLVANEIVRLNPTLHDEAIELASACFKAGGVPVVAPKKKGNDSDEPIVAESAYLFFISNQQIEALALLAVTASENGVTIDKKEARLILKSFNSVDLALFGRMVADAPDLNVDAACQVAHAISTHRVQTESDYFTALDEEKARTPGEDAGAGMIGQVEFVSSTLYRYATINVDSLLQESGFHGNHPSSRWGIHRSIYSLDADGQAEHVRQSDPPRSSARSDPRQPARLAGKRIREGSAAGKRRRVLGELRRRPRRSADERSRSIRSRRPAYACHGHF